MQYVTTCGGCGWAAAEVTTIQNVADRDVELPSHGFKREAAEASLVYVLDCSECGGLEARTLSLIGLA